MPRKGKSSYKKHHDWIDTYHGGVVPWGKDTYKAKIQTRDLKVSVNEMLKDRRKRGKPIPLKHKSAWPGHK